MVNGLHVCSTFQHLSGTLNRFALASHWTIPAHTHARCCWAHWEQFRFQCLPHVDSCLQPFDHWTTCSTNWATAAHINDSWVCWMSRRAGYLGCAQEIFVKSTLPISNSLYCCHYQLLFWASALSKCWQLWCNTTFSRKSRFCRQKLCLEVRVWRRCREHCADFCTNITVIWFCRCRVMMCFSLEKLCLHPAKWYLEETAQPVPIPYFHRPDPTLSSNTRAILSNIRGNLQYLTVKRLKYRGSSLDLNPSHTCIRAVSAQHNYTTMLGWLTCNERWLKNETLYRSCEWPDWWAAWGRGARLLGGSFKHCKAGKQVANFPICLIPSDFSHPTQKNCN